MEEMWCQRLIEFDVMKKDTRDLKFQSLKKNAEEFRIRHDGGIFVQLSVR